MRKRKVDEERRERKRQEREAEKAARVEAAADSDQPAAVKPILPVCVYVCLLGRRNVVGFVPVHH